MRKRLFYFLVIVAFVAGIFLVGSSFRDQADTIRRLEDIQRKTDRELALILAATDPKAQKQNVAGFFKALRAEIQKDVSEIKVSVSRAGTDTLITRTVVVPGPTRTVIRCVRPNGRPC